MGNRFPTASAARLAVLAGVLAGAGTALTAGPAQAQFFWDQPRYSADDVARIALQHGFRPMAQPTRNDSVYLADVIDQRGRQERLVVSAESGEILQRFYMSEGRRYRRYADPSIPRGPVPPGLIPNDDNRLVTRLAPEDGARPRFFEPDEQERPRRPRRSRTDPTTDRVARPAPVESKPLAPATPAPAALRPAPVAEPAATQAAFPAPGATPPAVAPAATPAPAAAEAKPSRPISRDPLAIPGSREQDQASAAAKPVAKPQAPARAAVPVAPLE